LFNIDDGFFQVAQPDINEYETAHQVVMIYVISRALVISRTYMNGTDMHRQWVAKWDTMKSLMDSYNEWDVV
jgi:hypothetical protein